MAFLVLSRMIDASTAESKPLKLELTWFGRRQPAGRALVAPQYGIGGMIAAAVWSEVGDGQCFTRSDQAVRHTGLDVTVDQSDRRRANGYLTRQGPEILRWALFKEVKNSSPRSRSRRRLLHQGQASPRRQDRSGLDRQKAGPPLLSHPAIPRPRSRLRHAIANPTLTALSGGTDRPQQTPGSRGRKLPTPACPPAIVLDGLERLSRSRSHPATRRGLPEIEAVVADDTVRRAPR